MKVNRQRVMHCPCGNARLLALDLCSTCYTLKRQDQEYFGGLRETVLERDGHRCRGAMPRDGISGRSSCITVCLESQFSNRCSPSVQPAMQRSIERRLFSRRCLRFFFSYGGNSTQRGMSRSRSTSLSRSLVKAGRLFREESEASSISDSNQWFAGIRFLGERRIPKMSTKRAFSPSAHTAVRKMRRIQLSASLSTTFAPTAAPMNIVKARTVPSL